jgi:hypothetical protein
MLDNLGSRNHLEFTPVIIIGAGRSGTNALRDSLSMLPGFRTWPCDEIDAIWRYGNLFVPHDELTAEHVTPYTRNYIRRAFIRCWKSTGRPPFVVEKTCANSLRVPFVAATLPEARYIHIVRDGFDVTGSAVKRWSGIMEVARLPYYFAKARFVPMLSIPVFAWKFIMSRIQLLLGIKKRFSIWGPRFKGISGLQSFPVEEICAHQWMACVSSSFSGLSDIEQENVYFLRYEDLTAKPVDKMREILAFLGYEVSTNEIENSVRNIKMTSVGKGAALKKLLSDETVKNIMCLNEKINEKSKLYKTENT